IEVTVVTATPPVIQSVAPQALVAGERAVITGEGFRRGLKVPFCTVEASEVVFHAAGDKTRIEVVTPSGLAVGDVEVRVRNSNGLESAPNTVRIVAQKGGSFWGVAACAG